MKNLTVDFIFKRSSQFLMKATVNAACNNCNHMIVSALLHGLDVL